MQILRNERAADGQRSLVSVPGLPAVTGVRTACAADLEADGDLDIVLGTTDGLVIWRNLDGTVFELATAGIAGPSGGVRDVVTVDWNRDLAMDVVAVLDDGTAGVLENLLHSRFRWVSLEGVNAGA
ncbi:MAG: FG-GAP repeat domain-containing protein, partial [Planctomycetaceae bacterium]